jgi:hypothetical protein
VAPPQDTAARTVPQQSTARKERRVRRSTQVRFSPCSASEASRRKTGPGLVCGYNNAAATTYDARVPETAIERLERRYQQLARQEDDVAFLRQISTYIDALDSERSARRILKRLGRDAEAAVTAFNATEHELVEEADRIRRRLAEEAPEIDNSEAPEPDRATHAYGRWMLGSFASFDRLAANDRRIEFSPLPYYDTSDKTPLATMLIILEDRLQVAQHGDQVGILEDQENLRPDLNDFGRQIHNVREKHNSALNRFKEQGRTLPGLADERLRVFPAALEPEPFLIEEGEDDDSIAERAFLRGIEQLGIIGTMRSALAGQHLDAGERDAFTRAVEFLRAEADRLHEEIVQRLSRGEGESRIRRSLIFIGRGSLNVGRIIAVAAITTIVGLLIGAYLAKWLPGQDDHPKLKLKPEPVAPTTTTAS